MKKLAILLMLVACILPVFAAAAPYATLGFATKSYMSTVTPEVGGGSVRVLSNMIGPRLDLGAYIPLTEAEQFGLDVGADVEFYVKTFNYWKGQKISLVNLGNSAKFTPNFNGFVMAAWRLGDKVCFNPEVGIYAGLSQFNIGSFKVGETTVTIPTEKGFSVGARLKLGMTINFTESVHMLLNLQGDLAFYDGSKFVIKDIQKTLNSVVSANIGIGGTF